MLVPTGEAYTVFANILHDIRCAIEVDYPQRFEVEGAGAAADYLR